MMRSSPIFRIAERIAMEAVHMSYEGKENIYIVSRKR